MKRAHPAGIPFLCPCPLTPTKPPTSGPHTQPSSSASPTHLSLLSVMDTIQASGYTSLGPYDPSKQASYVSYLSQVIHAVPSAIHPLQREILLKALMADLGACEWGQERKSNSVLSVGREGLPADTPPP